VRAVAIEIEDRIREVCGRSPGGTEGQREQSWVLLDYGDVIVHIFLDETREFYEIERLYKDVPRLEWRA
jgi:ribosome-associated protein